MLDLSQLSNFYADFRDCSLSQLEERLVTNVGEIGEILGEYLKMKYNESFK